MGSLGDISTEQNIPGFIISLFQNLKKNKSWEDQNIKICFEEIVRIDWVGV